MFHLDNEKNPIAETLRICQELWKEGSKASQENPSLNPSIIALIGETQYSELCNLSKNYYFQCEKANYREIPDRIKAVDENFKIKKQKQQREEAMKNQGLDDETFADTLHDLSKKHYCKPDALKISESQGKFTVNTSFYTDHRSDSLSLTSAALDLSSPYHRAVHVGRVVSNVPYAVNALNNQSPQRLSDLNVGQIQLAAMFLDAVRSDASEPINIKDQGKSIEAFKKFAKDKKSEYDLRDDQIEKLATAMSECHAACGKGDPGKLKGKPLAQALYVSHQLDLLRYLNQNQTQEIDNYSMRHDKIEQNIEDLVGPEQGSLLINRSKEIIKATGIPPLIDNPDEELDASKFVATTKEVNQKVTREEIKNVKEAMNDTLEKFRKNKREGIFVNAIESLLAKFDLELDRTVIFASDEDRRIGMEKARDALECFEKLSSVDKKALDDAKKAFRSNAERNTGFFGIRPTATSRKFEQSLKTKSPSRQ